MSSWPPTLLCLLIGIAGWYYLFYSKAAHRLESIEVAATNRRRIRLRRANGVTMLLLAVLLYIGFRAVDFESHRPLFMLVWMAVVFMLFIVVLLAWIDIRLTMNLRGGKKPH